MERKGIRDLMDMGRYRATHIREALIKNKVEGNWEGRSGLQNVYNLVDGKTMPRDASVFIFLADFFNTPVREILSRYSTSEKYSNESSTW
jgi:hypothetical protein